MRTNTRVAIRAKNVGKPSESYSSEPKPVVEAMRDLTRWLLTQTMAKRIDIMVGRDLADLSVIDLDPRVRSRDSGFIQSLDEMFSVDDFDDATRGDESEDQGLGSAST